MSITATLDNTIAEHLDIPENVARAAHLASHDLYFGPHDEYDEDIPSFPDALAIVRDWADDIGDMYVHDATGEVTDREPVPDAYSPSLDAYASEGYDEDDADDWIVDDIDGWYHYDRADVLRTVFDRELVSML